MSDPYSEQEKAFAYPPVNPSQDPPLKRLVYQHILPLSQEAADIEAKLLEVSQDIITLYQETSRAHAETASAKSILDYTEMELRVETFAMAAPAKKKKVEPRPGTPEAEALAAAEAAAPAPIISGTTVAERELQFEHYLQKIFRTDKLHPYTRAAQAHADFQRREEGIALELKEKERLLSAYRAIADLKTARLLALSRAV